MKVRFRFEKLEVWQEARSVNRIIYTLARRFPRPETFAMASQVRRAAVSIAANIAEGSGRNSDKDFPHFLEQAYASLKEVASVLYLALDEAYVSENDINPLFDQLARLAKRIASLNRSLSVAVSKTPFGRQNSVTLDSRHSTFD